MLVLPLLQVLRLSEKKTAAVAFWEKRRWQEKFSSQETARVQLRKLPHSIPYGRKILRLQVPLREPQQQELRKNSQHREDGKPGTRERAQEKPQAQRRRRHRLERRTRLLQG